MNLKTLIPIVLLLPLIPAEGGVTETEAKTTVTVETTPFDQGKLELEGATGAYFSVGHAGQRSLNYSSSAYRLGVMLYNPSGDSWLRGNFELMLQVFEGSVISGPGHYLVGAAPILRYNFVQPNAKWVPYIQIGGGGVYNDISKNQGQRLIGQQWEFDLEAATGIQYMFNDRWSANIEADYRHISNAGMSSRNIGLNSLGGSTGLGFHF
jgi:hypothetical protein